MVCTIFMYFECVESADSVAKLSSSMKSHSCLKRYFGPTSAKSLQERLIVFISATETGGTAAGPVPSSVNSLSRIKLAISVEVHPWYFCARITRDGWVAVFAVQRLVTID